MRYITAILTITLILGSSAAALSQTKSEVPVVQSTKHRYKHYGWQTLLVDITGIGLFRLTDSWDQGKDLLVISSGLIYWFGASAVHGAHKNYRGIGYSLALRAGLPLVGAAAVGTAMSRRGCSDDEDCESWGIEYLLGGILGMGTAMLADSIFVSRAKVKYEVPLARTLILVPIVDIRSSSVSVGLGGSF